MKKVLFLFVAMAFAMSANAQNMTEQMAKIDELCVKLGKALDKTPKECGIEDVDNYINGCKASAVGAVASAAQLQDFYKREIGATVDGVTDVTVTKPTLEEWISLSVTIATQTAGTAEVGKEAEKASKAVKDAPKMKSISMGKAVTWSGDLHAVTTEALSEEGKAINQIIETLKSGNNL